MGFILASWLGCYKRMSGTQQHGSGQMDSPSLVHAQCQTARLSSTDISQISQLIGNVDDLHSPDVCSEASEAANSAPTPIPGTAGSGKQINGSRQTDQKGNISDT